MIWLCLLPGLVYAAAAASVHVSVDTVTQFQEMDGLGVSEAFQRANDVLGRYGLSPKNTTYVLDLLFSLDKGAGFAILRNGIGASSDTLYSRIKSIEPVSPGSPQAKPTYVWDRNDTGQFLLAQEAYARGLKRLYGSAWSAPGFMKTTQDDIGGYLCGVTGADCPSGSWVEAYTAFLLQWVRFYEDSGVRVSELGFLNEPEIKTTYVSMLSNATQAADVIRVLAPKIKAAGLDLKLTCCDTLGWGDMKNKLVGLQAGPDPAEAHLDIITGHGYGSGPTYPLKTDKKTWQTEWADQSGRYTPHTFYKNDGPGEGLLWAVNIQTAFVQANVSAFLYWIGAENTKQNMGLINLNNDEVIPTKRYWAFAQFSKFARPGARRIDANSDNSDVTVSSFLNTDGRIATQIINSGAAPADLEFEMRGSLSGARAVLPYLTDNDNDLTPLSAINVSGGRFKARVPAKSLVSFVTTKSARAGRGKC